jgi:putative tricarboxylic transport membrane protein
MITTPQGVLIMIAGLTVGFLAGVLPGLSGPNASALLLPVALHFPPSLALALIISVYCGTAFGGTIPAILINVPGEGGSAATALDGYPMAKAGKAELAIGLARMASVLGGVIGSIVAIVLIAPLAQVTVSVGPPELFLISLIGMTVCASLVGDRVPEGLLVAMLGMLLSAMSVGPLSATPRLDFGLPQLYDGIPLVAAVVGIFAFGEMLLLPAESDPGSATSALQPAPGARKGPVRTLFARLGMGDPRQIMAGIRMTLKYPVTVIQASVVGLFVGVIPGMG